MALAVMQKGNLDASADVAVHGKIKKESVGLDTVTVTRVTFDVGARWSRDLKDYAGTESCELSHVALVLSGHLKVVMRSEEHTSELQSRQYLVCRLLLAIIELGSLL